MKKNGTPIIQALVLKRTKRDKVEEAGMGNGEYIRERNLRKPCRKWQHKLLSWSFWGLS